MCRDLINRVEVVPGGGGLADGPGAQVEDVVAVLPDLSVELHYSTLRPVTHTSTGQDQKYYQCKELHRQRRYGPSLRDYTIQYLEYKSVCPFVQIGSPSPLSRKRLWNLKGGRQHSLAGEGSRGANSDDWRDSLALCVLCGL
jgi:hypothetical protein